MPRRARCVLPGVPYHVTQRGVDRQATFSLDEDRHTYLRLLRENLSEADVRVWGWCLMSNHVHLVLLPDREDSLSLLMRRVHGRYAQYYNTRWGRTGCSPKCQSAAISPTHRARFFGKRGLRMTASGVLKQTAKEGHFLREISQAPPFSANLSHRIQRRRKSLSFVYGG